MMQFQKNTIPPPQKVNENSKKGVGGGKGSKNLKKKVWSLIRISRVVGVGGGSMDIYGYIELFHFWKDHFLDAQVIL